MPDCVFSSNSDRVIVKRLVFLRGRIQMNVVARFIESGILDMYVLGATTSDENREVERMAALYTEVRKEIEEIQKAVAHLLEKQSVAPCPTVKPFLLAIVDYLERRQNGEPESFPPILHAGSTLKQYEEWLQRKDLRLSEDFKDFEAKIIGHNPQAITAIVWIKEGAPLEVHEDVLEKFLIVEGACMARVEKEIHLLFRGDYLSIPPHKSHSIEIISSTPCKAILQRVAVVSQQSQAVSRQS